MMTPVHRAVLVSALFGLSLATARDALADPTKAQCVEADTAAQSDRRGEHLRAAREHLELCSKPACPALVREDCFQRLSDLESMAPTIVFAAKDAAGEDVAAVRVSMDGAPFATELAGAALPVDPGLHTFTFDTDGASTVEKKVVVREGEKGRQERIIFSTLHAPAVLVVAPLPPPSVDHATTSSWTSQKTAAVVAGAVGLAGVIAGSITGAMAFSRWSRRRFRTTTAHLRSPRSPTPRSSPGGCSSPEVSCSTSPPRARARRRPRAGCFASCRLSALVEAGCASKGGSDAQQASPAVQ
jgi:hypothetical protein